MPPAAPSPGASRAPVRRRPPGRYDEPSRSLPRAVAVVLIGLFLGLLVALAWTLYQRYGIEDVPVRPTGFEVLGDDAVRVEFEVTPPDGGTAWCLVRARDEGGAEVGREFVRVPARDDGEPVRVEHVLPTTALPVTGEVPRCLPTPPPDDAPTTDPTAP